MTATELDRAITALPADPEPGPEPSTVVEELIAMRQVSKRLEGLDAPTRQRVMRWLTARYGEQQQQGEPW